MKEDVITRIGEMGVIIKQGKISFDPSLLNQEEILDRKRLFEFYAISGESRQIEIGNNQLAFTFCQVPVVYTFSNKQNITVVFKNGSVEEVKGSTLSKKISQSIFSRSNDIEVIEVMVLRK